MREINLTFVVDCQRPLWAIKSYIGNNFTDSRYRIYVDTDLITERTWLWDNNIYLHENIWIYCEDSIQYTVKLEPILYIPEQANFSIDNFNITNSNADINKIDDLQVNFTLR